VASEALSEPRRIYFRDLQAINRVAALVGDAVAAVEDEMLGRQRLDVLGNVPRPGSRRRAVAEHVSAELGSVSGASSSRACDAPRYPSPSP
jgi:hypothetical protein